jgi:hypothetical protein
MSMSHLEKAFWRFHHDHPNVYLLFDKFARQILAAGFRRYSADAVIHRIRWHTNIVARTPELRFTNNHAAYYARLWMHNNPSHAGLFELRAVTEAPEGDDPDTPPSPDDGDEDEPGDGSTPITPQAAGGEHARRLAASSETHLAG